MMNPPLNPTPRYRHLNTDERLQICEFIRSHVPLARDKGHPFHRFARWQISLLLWRWTADAFCLRENVIRPDAAKYNIEMLPATPMARELRTKTKSGLRHEHSVPRIVLTDLIINGDLTVQQIYDLLTRHCRAVIVTLQEDQELPKHGKKAMGTHWASETGCPYDRYRAAGLMDQIVWPSAEHDCADDMSCRQR